METQAQSSNNTAPKRKHRERALVILCVLGLCFLATILTSDRAFQYFFGATVQESAEPVLGRITYRRKDVRHKNLLALEWQPAADQERVRLEDEVFSGLNSSSRVSLDDGEQIDLGENTLMVFSRFNRVAMPNLREGNFRLAFSGTVKIAVRDKVTELTGDNSEVQVTIGADQQPKFRLLKGQAQIGDEMQASKLVLQPDRFIVLGIPKSAAPSQAPKIQEQIVEPPSLSPTESPNVDYTLRLYDAYALQDQQLAIKPPATCFSAAAEMRWTQKGPPTDIFGEVSQSSLFSEPVYQFQARSGSASTRTLCEGDNFWRISLNNTDWSAPQVIRLRAHALELPRPLVQFRKSHVELMAARVKVGIHIGADPDIQNIVLEVSSSPTFSARQTKVYWRSLGDLALDFDQPGHYYARARGANAKTEITDASNVSELNITRPSLPIAPRLAKNELRALEGERVHLAWRGANAGATYEIEIVHPQGTSAKSKRLSKEGVIWIAGKKGRYEVNVRAFDKWGRRSKKSERGIVIVEARPIVAPMIAAKEPQAQPAKREPSSIPEMSAQYKMPAPIYLNANYGSSKLSIQGANSTMYSQDQMDQGKNSPSLIMLGLRSETWFGNNGLEALVDTTVSPLNSQSGNMSDPLQLEARYQRRWILPFNPLSRVGTTQLSVIGGFEYYRNPGSQLFSPAYQIFKTGLALKLPIASRWDAGIEGLIGEGIDSSKKYEFSGYADFFLQSQWSIGLGYKLNLFQAGSAAATPLGLPFKEGYGEGFSVLRWHY